jgi:peptide subunit release factor RF-3
MSYSHARWVTRKDGSPVEISDLNRAHNTVSVVDVRDRPVLLFMGEWQIRSAERDLPEYEFAETAIGVVVRND